MADIRAGLPAGGYPRCPERGRDHSPTAKPKATPHNTHRRARATPVLETAPTTAVWTGNCSMPVELARLVGPVGGVIETPAQGLLRATVASGSGPPLGRGVTTQPPITESAAEVNRYATSWR